MTTSASRAAEVVGLPATEIAERVRSGDLLARDVLHQHLARIGAVDAGIGAFQKVRAAAALTEAEAVERRPDLADLPLAGVPVAVKDNIDVAGEPSRNGSLGTDPGPRPQDHEVVRRLRAAGAVIMGKTRVPELCSWPWTDGSFGVTRSPWDLSRSPGGSSGGSAAAVAGRMVPIAHGSDGGGSVRIPAAACGLVGVKPTKDLVPGTPGRTGWYGLSVNGALATTVTDAALLLSVLADRPDLAAVAPLTRPLRVAWSVRPQLPFAVDPAYLDAVAQVTAALAAAGHVVVAADPPFVSNPTLTSAARATAGMAEDADGIPLRRLESRTRPQVLVGRALRRRGWLRDAPRDTFRAATTAFFADYDVLVTPTIGGLPAGADGWARRGMVANARGARWACFTSAWNVAGVPAVAVPIGRHPSGFPTSVQLISGHGQEALLLSVAGLLESELGWERHPPDAS